MLPHLETILKVYEEHKDKDFVLPIETLRRFEIYFEQDRARYLKPDSKEYKDYCKELYTKFADVTQKYKDEAASYFLRFSNHIKDVGKIQSMSFINSIHANICSFFNLFKFSGLSAAQPLLLCPSPNLSPCATSWRSPSSCAPAQRRMRRGEDSTTPAAQGPVESTQDAL